MRDPVGYVEACRRRYGPVFTLRFIGMKPFVYVTEPAAARAVYAADRTVNRAGEVRKDFLLPLVGEHSLLVTEGDAWLAHRKLLGPVFQRGHVEGYAEEIAAITAAAVDGWPRGEPFALRDRMQEITLEVILRIVFGVADEARAARFRTLLPELNQAAATPLLFLAPPAVARIAERVQWLPGPWRAFFKTRNAVDRLIYEEIAARRAAPGADRHDALSLLLDDMDDAELRDELITLLEAGHETTATALAWAFERLLRHPQALATLTAEIEAGESTEYLDAVVRETLRTRPVVPDTPRRLAGPLEVGPYTIPAGWHVTVAITSVQLDPAGAEDPQEFRPERFVDGETVRDAWVPFGGGKRHCVGSHLALLEMRIVIAEVVRRVRLETVDAAPERQRLQHVTIAPSDGARVIAHAGPMRVVR